MGPRQLEVMRTIVVVVVAVAVAVAVAVVGVGVVVGVGEASVVQVRLVARVECAYLRSCLS